MMRSGASHYQRMNVESSLTDASPHQLITMLFDGCLGKLAQGRGHIERLDYENKSRTLGAAISILDALKSALDHDAGTEVADNLERLYDYMIRRVFSANAENDVAAVDEVVQLLKTVKEGWDGIAEPVASGVTS